MTRFPAVAAFAFALAALLAACSGPGARPGDGLAAQAVLPDADELWIVVRDGPRPVPWTAGDLARAGLVGRDAAGREVRPALEELALDCDVLGRLALVRTRQVYAPSDVALVDAELVWPLPPTATPTDLVLEAGDRRLRAVVRERDEAERLFAAARAQGKRASLVTAERGVLRQRLAGLPADVAVAVTLEAFHDLPWLDGRCELDLALVGTAATRLVLDVRIDAGVDVEGFALEGLDAPLEREGTRAARLRYDGPSPGRAARLAYRVGGERKQAVLFVHEDGDDAVVCLVAYAPPSRASAPPGEPDAWGPWTFSMRQAASAPWQLHGGDEALVALARLDAPPPPGETPGVAHWGSGSVPVRRVDVPDGPLGRALAGAWARGELVRLRREGLADRAAPSFDDLARRFRVLALEHGLVTFATAFVLVDARSGR